jgi:hypothetical protein
MAVKDIGRKVGISDANSLQLEFEARRHAGADLKRTEELEAEL